jgi:hypothetical protein
MRFNPLNFRRITIRTADFTTLILIKASGDAMYARGRHDKDQLISKFEDDSDLLLWAWVGQYHTDIFMLTKQDIDQYFK